MYQALQETGAVGIGYNGQINSVTGIPLSNRVTYQLYINGQLIANAALFVQLYPGDTLTLRLIYSPVLY